MKKLKIIRTICIDVAVVLLITLVVSLLIKKPVIVPIIEGITCFFSIIGAYIYNKKITNMEKLSNS